MKFIGIQQIWYGDSIAQEITKENFKQWLQSATEVKNSHQDTWGYSQDDPTVTEYVNELTGKPYHRDVTQGGAKTINFTLGEYAVADKVALQGGTALGSSLGWKAPNVPAEINKAIVAKTKTGNYIVFTNASIVAKGNFVEKNIGLGVTAVAMESGVAGVADEYMLDGSVIDAG